MIGTVKSKVSLLLLGVLLCMSGVAFFYDMSHKADFIQLTMAREEMYTPELGFIRSLDKLKLVVDSIAGTELLQGDSLRYVLAADSIVRERFYHGFSQLNWKQNHVAHVLAAMIRWWKPYVDFPVSANEILKYAHGGCSQQAIVLAAFLKNAGFNYRYVGFHAEGKGHFALQVYIGEKAHYLDPDLERMYVSKGILSVQELQNDPKLFRKSYRGILPDSLIQKWMSNKIRLGPVNEAAGNHAWWFQFVCGILSYTVFPMLCLISLSIYWFNKRLHSRTEQRESGSVNITENNIGVIVPD